MGERDSDAQDHLRISTDGGHRGQQEYGKNDVAPWRDKSTSNGGGHTQNTRRKAKFTLESSGLDDNDSDLEGPDLTASTSALTTEPSAPQEKPPAPNSPSSSTPFHLPIRLIPRAQQIVPHQPPPQDTMHSLPRPGLTRRTAAVGPSMSRRYTFAMAMNDEGISDEVLVEELERIRAVRALSAGSLYREPTEDSQVSLTGVSSSDSPDFEDVWDVETEEAPLEMELELGPDHSMHNRRHTFLDGQEALCDSPMSEDNWMLQANQAPRSQNRMSLPPLSASTSQLPRPISLQPYSTQPFSSSAIARWHTTRHALLTCRELIRTERSYLSSLLSLLAGRTETPPPSLMVHYVAVLVNTSRIFLDRMERNPTPAGVAKAFVSLEHDLETAYVGWCGAVGGWFENDAVVGAKGKDSSSRASFRRLSKIRSPEHSAATRKTLANSTLISPTSTTSGSSDSASSSSSTSESSSLATSPTSSTSGCTSNTTPLSSSCSSVAPSSSDNKVNAPAVHPPTSLAGPLSARPSRGMFSMSRTVSAPGSRRSSFTNMDQHKDGSFSSPAKPARKPLVRDLAILPTQRVMRYVLLFRDLLAHAPENSISRIELERAAEAANRVAKQCDRAQDNAAFIHSPTSPSSSQDPLLPANGKAGPHPAKAAKGVQPREATVSLRSSKSSENGEKEKPQTPARKLTKSRNHRRSGSTHEFRPDSSDKSTGLPRTNSVIEDDSITAIRRRSQSHTNVASTADGDMPRQNSSQRLSVLNLSVAIGGFLGRSSSAQSGPESAIDSPRKKASHPPSSFSLRGGLTAGAPPPAVTVPA